MWFFFLQSGVHPTVAGVVLAFTIPAKTRINSKKFFTETQSALDRMRDKKLIKEGRTISPDVNSILYAIEDYCEKATAPAHRLEHKLHPYVAFFVMPVFALANAGVEIGSIGNSILNSVSIGVIAGLVVGKVAGITLFSYLSVKLKLGVMPSRSSIRQLVGTGFLAGIGFTMSLFIAGLAFGDSELLDFAKVGIITGSLISAIAGYYLLKKPVKN
jgi:NhaA family Na+:H+ antiporter